MKKHVYLLSLAICLGCPIFAIAAGPYDDLRPQLVQIYGNIPEVDQFIELANKHWKFIRKWHIKMRRSLWPPMSEENRKALGLIEDKSKPERLSSHHPFVADWFIDRLELSPRTKGPHFGSLVKLLNVRDAAKN
ncbi:MAG: hypothetical protein K2L24_01355 [Opitutales bacterium]|nr:hypothetical protein [Opitutales bacterium]